MGEDKEFILINEDVQVEIIADGSLKTKIVLSIGKDAEFYSKEENLNLPNQPSQKIIFYFGFMNKLNGNMTDYDIRRDDVGNHLNMDIRFNGVLGNRVSPINQKNKRLLEFMPHLLAKPIPNKLKINISLSDNPECILKNYEVDVKK